MQREDICETGDSTQYSLQLGPVDTEQSQADTAGATSQPMKTAELKRTG